MSKRTLRYVKIDKSNLDEATAFQNEIFPNNDAYRNYYESVYGLRDATYYIVYLEEEKVGLVGIYFEEVDKTSAWLGWFGVKEEYRRHHIGQEIIKFHEDLARKMGYRYSRLFTDMNDNEVAISFYRSCGYTSEPYINEDDPQSKVTRELIFSKALYDEACPPWGNRNINLTRQVAKEKYRKS